MNDIQSMTKFWKVLKSVVRTITEVKWFSVSLIEFNYDRPFRPQTWTILLSLPYVNLRYNTKENSLKELVRCK